MDVRFFCGILYFDIDNQDVLRWDTSEVTLVDISSRKSLALDEPKNPWILIRVSIKLSTNLESTWPEYERTFMKVFLLKDVEKVGLAGEIIKVSDGYGLNFIIPTKLGVEVTPANEASFNKRKKVVEHRHEVIASKTSILAEKIKSLSLVLKRKLHDNSKLYGSVSTGEVADLLAAQGVSVAKNQIELGKAIKAKGSYEITIKLSSSLQPKVTLTIVPE